MAFMDQVYGLLGNSTRLGIDLGANSIKVVAVKNVDKGFKLLGAGFEETPQGCINDGELGDPRSLLDALRNAISNAGIKNPKGMLANVGLRGLSVTFTRALLPKRPPDEMSNQVVLEAQSQIGSDLLDWIVEYQILTEPNAEGQVVVMIVGAKRQVAEDYLTLLKSVGLVPCIFDCDLFAMSNILEYSMGGHIPDITMCMDIGKDSTKIHIMDDGIPLFLTSNDLGGHSVTELISRHMSVDMEQAETLKIQSGNTNPEIAHCIHQYLENLADNIQQTLLYVSQSEGSPISQLDRIVVSGGGSALSGLLDFFAKRFNTRVEFNDPFIKAEISSKAQSTMLDPSYIYGVASGLALRRRGDKPV